MSLLVLIAVTSALKAVSDNTVDCLLDRITGLAPLLEDLDTDHRVLESSLSEFASSGAFKSDKDRSQHLELLFSKLVLKSDQIWNDINLSVVEFFESWLILAERVNLLTRSFQWIPCLDIDSYIKVCIKQFQALHATIALVTKTEHDDRPDRSSIRESRHKGARVYMHDPIQLLWLDLAQDAMTKFNEAQGEDTDGTVQEIKQTAQLLKEIMPKAIPRDHLYQLSEKELRRYQQSLQNEICMICAEGFTSCLGERIHCEYSCGNFVHRKCMLSYLRTYRPGKQALCLYGCKWPVLSFSVKSLPSELG